MGSIFSLLTESTYLSCGNGEGNPLHPVVIEFLDGMRQCLELDTDRDSMTGREVRSCFALFVTNLIDCFPRKLLLLTCNFFKQKIFIVFPSQLCSRFAT